MESFSSPRLMKLRSRRRIREERARTCEVLAVTCIALATLPVTFVAGACGVLMGAPTLHLIPADITALETCAAVGFTFLFAAIGFAIAHQINSR